MTLEGLKLGDIQTVIAGYGAPHRCVGIPELGAFNHADPDRDSDTFVEFAGPLMKKLGYPTLLCNTLTVASDGFITGYRLRQTDGKKKVAEAMREPQLHRDRDRRFL